MMKIDEIKAVAEIVAANDLAELKLESEGFILQIKRGPKTVVTNTTVSGASLSAPVQTAAPAVVAPVPAVTEAPAAKRVTIDSPLVGTVYRAGSPEAAPFVKVGDKVTPDTVVCIVEAMKVMNEIKAEKSGVIKDILVENGSAVEFGQPLFVLE